MPFSFPTAALLCGISLASASLPAQSAWGKSSPVEVSGSDLRAIEPLKEISLRGYGRISGASWTDDKTGSILRITCEDEEKAKLTQAKFLSDLQVLPGAELVSLEVGSVKIDALEIEGQGVVAALRSGANLFIPAAATQEDWRNFVTNHFTGDLSRASSRAEKEVPMWLDRWDKYGFRFYYRAWDLPKDPEVAKNYDISKEFEFAQKNGEAGFIIYGVGNRIDTAEGLDNGVWEEWAAKEAAARKLPIGINLAAGQFAAPPWLLNRFRAETNQSMPQFVGNMHNASDAKGGIGTFSWSSTDGKDAELGVLQGVVRRMAAFPNVTTFLEPHGELRAGNQDMFTEYGPVADASFRKFLQERYENTKALNASWQGNYSSWDEVRVPEVASFSGWGPQALDLTGDWHVGWEEFSGTSLTKREMEKTLRIRAIATEKAPEDWYSESFDDSSWPTILAPGHDRIMFLEKRPAVFRQKIEVPAQWLAKNPRVWLYVWSLNRVTPESVTIAVNGQKVSETPLEHTIHHWEGVEVTKHLRPGSNQLAIRLPKGFLAYRVYLSPDSPRQYPDFGPGGNMRWVDFAEWIQWTRINAARRGMEMIRHVDQDRQIDLMAPDYYADGIKKLALQYGGNFKNTGYMLTFWNDYLSSIMRGAGLPFSVEPSSPAKDLPNFKKKIGLVHTEGIQGLDYFIHIGRVMWEPEIRKYFEENVPLIKLIGKYHSPQAEVAALHSTSVNALMAYPWGSDYNTNFRSGYWTWNVRSVLRSLYESDILTESSFASGDASRYKVIIDTNTSIMNEKLVGEIEQYVRAGGTFVTFVQTGRHTPAIRDSWPISRLTGYRVKAVDSYDKKGNPLKTRKLENAPGQSVFTNEWQNVAANGLTLEKEAPDAQDLLLWEDGSVAAGVRQLGKGRIVQIGCKFTGDSIPDRVDFDESNVRRSRESLRIATNALRTTLIDILRWRDVQPVPAKLVPTKDVLLRHYLSNNGLYDVWVLWNQSTENKASLDLQLQTNPLPAWAFDFRSGKKIPVDNGGIKVELPPEETFLYLTPRNHIADAPLDWFNLQRSWWRGTEAPPATPLPPAPHLFSSDLSKDWSFKPLGEDDQATAFIAADVDDSSWEKADMGVWTFPDKKDVNHAVLRRKFTIPEAWKNGEPSLWLVSWLGPTFADKGRIWLDGKLILDQGSEGLLDFKPEGGFKPGSEHTIAVEIEAKGSLAGAKGATWLWFWPTPESQIDLAGLWSPSEDVLRYGSPISLPGKYDCLTLRRSINIPSEKSGKQVVLDVTGTPLGVVINGKWVSRFWQKIGPRFHLNITPWIKFGEENEVELVNSAAGRGNVEKVSLNFYEAGVYP